MAKAAFVPKEDPNTPTPITHGFVEKRSRHANAAETVKLNMIVGLVLNVF